MVLSKPSNCGILIGGEQWSYAVSRSICVSVVEGSPEDRTGNRPRPLIALVADGPNENRALPSIEAKTVSVRSYNNDRANAGK